MVGEDEKAERERIAAMGARFTNTEPSAPPAANERKRSYTEVWVIFGGLAVIGAFAFAAKSIAGGDDKPAAAPAVAPSATPIETGPEPRITGVDGDGAKVAQLIAKKCARGVTGRSRDAWGASEIRVTRNPILHHGRDMDVWSLEVSMPSSYTDVTDGNTLWYQVTTDNARINATKDIAAKLCGLKAHDLFVDL